MVLELARDRPLRSAIVDQPELGVERWFGLDSETAPTGAHLDPARDSLGHRCIDEQSRKNSASLFLDRVRVDSKVDGVPLEAQMKMAAPATYKPSDVYATAKVFVAWWAAELARKLPAGMTVNAVSPGSTPDTNAVRNAPFYMRYFMIPLFKLIPGMSHSIADGAQRYLDVAAGDETGKFFASKPGKMTGPLAQVELDHIDDRAGQTAAWNVTVELAGVGYPVAA